MLRFVRLHHGFIIQSSFCFLLSTFVSMRTWFCILMIFSYSGMSDMWGLEIFIVTYYYLLTYDYAYLNTSLFFLTPERPPDVLRLNKMSDFWLLLFTLNWSCHIPAHSSITWPTPARHSLPCRDLVSPELSLVTACHYTITVMASGSPCSTWRSCWPRWGWAGWWWTRRTGRTARTPTCPWRSW